MDRWNRICNSIIKHKNQNSKEDVFQTEIEYIFEYVLGWSFNEIINKKRNKVFSANAYAPDIIIKNNENGNDLFVVELKRPNISIEKHRDQLFDYMRLRYSQFGLLIGDKLQLFCEIPINTKPPKLILETDFIRDAAVGIEFIKLFSKDRFSIESIESYALQKIKELEETNILNKLINFLTSSEGNEYVLQLVLNDLKDKHSSKIIEELKSKIYIKISDKSSLPKIEYSEYSPKKPRVFESYNSNEIVSESTKIHKRVPSWLRKPQQTNSQILLTYLEIRDNSDTVTFEDLEKRCKNIKNFKSNYYGMKNFGEKNHGKVFDEIGNKISLWEPVRNFIEKEYEKYKNEL